jgi:hypothetical protein
MSVITSNCINVVDEMPRAHAHDSMVTVGYRASVSPLVA